MARRRRGGEPLNAAAHIRPGERIIWSAHPSLIGLVPIVGYLVAALAGLYAAQRLGVEQPATLIRGTPALVLAVFGILAETIRRFVRLKFTTFIVTDQRFYAVTSFLETHARSIPLSRATAVTLRQPPAGRLLGYWNGHISTYGPGTRGLEIPAIRDGPGMLREMSAGMRRGANVSWLRGGD